MKSLNVYAYALFAKYMLFQKRAQLEQLYQKTRETVEQNTALQGRHQAAVKDITEKTKRIVS